MYNALVAILPSLMEVIGGYKDSMFIVVLPTTVTVSGCVVPSNSDFITIVLATEGVRVRAPLKVMKVIMTVVVILDKRTKSLV